MKQFLTLTLLLLLTVACHNESPQTVNLQAGNWDPNVRQTLVDLMNKHTKNAYAVFDFDQTSIVHNITHAVWTFQIEQLRFADAPQHNFLDAIPSPEDLMPGTELTFAQMGAILAAEYQSLRTQLNEGVPLTTIRQSDQYLDFRARMLSFLEKIDAQYGSTISFLWLPGQMTGYTQTDATNLIREAIAQSLGKDKLTLEQWRSPDGIWGGDILRGIWVAPEMKDLFLCLQKAGIETYICSATWEPVVEALACDAQLGFGLPADHVYGLRLKAGQTIVTEYAPDYIQPIREGKVSNIRTYVAPNHANAEPILVAGDSSGDIPMLTEFEQMQHGLIIDVGRNEQSAIGKLITSAKQENNKGKYLAQPTFEQ